MNLVSGGFGGAGGSSSNGFDVGTNPDVVSVAISHLYGEFYHTWENPPLGHQRNDRITKTCQHSAMKHRRENKGAPHPHPSALAVPSYHRILVKHGLIEKTLSIPDAYEVFLRVGADPEVAKLRRKVAHGSKIKHVPALYLATAMALQGMTKQELEALKLRIEKKRG